MAPRPAHDDAEQPPGAHQPRAIEHRLCRRARAGCGDHGNGLHPRPLVRVTGPLRHAWRSCPARDSTELGLRRDILLSNRRRTDHPVPGPPRFRERQGSGEVLRGDSPPSAHPPRGLGTRPRRRRSASNGGSNAGSWPRGSLLSIAHRVRRFGFKVIWLQAHRGAGRGIPRALTGT